MKEKRNYDRASSEKQYEPRTIGEIIDQMLRSNSAFSRAYLEHLAYAYPNTEPGIDLKLFTREPGRMEIGEMKSGMITRDGDDHYLFVEDATEMKPRKTVTPNPCIFEGECINVRRRPDSTLYVTLKRPPYEGTDGFSWFCRKAAQELLTMAEAFER